MTGDFELFAGLSDAERERLHESAAIRRFDRNTVIISEGDDTNSLFLIQSGKLKFFLSDDTGKEVILNTQGPGEYFGELALLDGAPRSVSVMTMEPTVLEVVSRDALLSCLRNEPDLALKLMKNMARRLRELSDEVRALALSDVYGRIRRLLRQLAEDSETGKVIVNRPTHQDISQRVGSSREMVSRVLKDLERGGYLEARGKDLLIKKRLPKHW